MFRKQALQTTLRTPRRSLLFLLLLALISALLASSLGMSASLSRALALCRENYSTIGLAEYISGGYPELSALDSAAGQAADALAAAVAPDDALLYYEPTRMALGDTDGLASRKTFDGGVLVLRVKQLVVTRRMAPRTTSTTPWWRRPLSPPTPRRASSSAFTPRMP